MVWQPGHLGNPNGYKGPRDRARRQVFDTIKNLGHRDALETLSYLQHNEQIEPGLRIAAASALAPYCHPKMQATPTPRFVENPIDVPDFERIQDAEAFLAKLPVRVARGELDFQSAQELCVMTNLWIQTQYQREELLLKTNPPAERDSTITVVGGLPSLPGTNIEMPQLNGHVADARALAAPTDVVPADDGTNQVPSEAVTEFRPGELKAQGPHPLQEHHFKAEPEPGKNSTNGGQEPCT